MFPFPKRRRRKPRADTSTVNWIIIGCVALAFLMNAGKGKELPKEMSPEGLKEAGEAIANAAPKAPIDVSNYKAVLSPEENALRMQDIQTGEGKPAVCGQKVSIAYEAFGDNGKAIDDSATEDKPLTFRIGGSAAMPALEHGVVGMSKGGVRNLYAPSTMAYGLNSFAREGVSATMPVRFKVTLLDVTPELPDMENNVFRIFSVQKGIGKTILCGEPVKVHITVWDVSGKKLYTSHAEGQEPLTFTPGKSEVMLGLEQGVIGMNTAGARTLMIPPSFQKTMESNAPAREIPLPDKQTVLVDVETVP